MKVTKEKKKGIISSVTGEFKGLGNILVNSTIEVAEKLVPDCMSSKELALELITCHLLWINGATTGGTIGNGRITEIKNASMTKKFANYGEGSSEFYDRSPYGQTFSALYENECGSILTIGGHCGCYDDFY